MDQPSTSSGSSPSPGPGDDATVISGSGSGSSRAGSSALRGSSAASILAPTAEIGRLLAGSMLGPYHLEEFIGGGGMGAVFRALDTTLDRIVAVKVLARRASDDEETLRRFRNEAQSAARLDHENIGRVHAVGSEGDWHFIVFEYIEGTNIRDLVREGGPFDPARTIDVAVQVADALEHASQREIVHRDIKPSNIVITPAGRARLVDMGLARLHHVAGDAELTASGMTLGTFDYISPEQARDPRAADVRSDLYSLGCTMFFMLVGRPPFAEGTLVQKLLQHQQAVAPAVDQVRPDVPRRLAAIIARLMEKDPLDRYQRPAVLAADLVACAEAEGLAVAAGRGAVPLAVAEPPASRRPTWLLPAILLAILVAGLWLRSVAERRGRVDGDPMPLPPSVDPPAVDRPAVDRPVRTTAELAAALAAAAEGGTIVVDDEAALDLPALTVAGRRLEIRAAAGRRPVLRVRPGPDGGGVRVNGGDLVLRGLAVHMTEPPPGASADVGRSLFDMSSGRLSCEGVVLRMPGGGRRQQADPAAFITVAGTSAVDVEIVLADVRAAGDADLLLVAAADGGRIGFRWAGGACLTPRRLLRLEGSREDARLDCSFDDVVAACQAGLVTSVDSLALPRPTRLSLAASGCRFIVSDPQQPFVEQSGIAAPPEYAAALDWRDLRCRYEGGRVFRRIDGAAERIEVPFGDASAPPVHQPDVGGLPVPEEWAGWGS